jgi:hypothetical protein
MENGKPGHPTTFTTNQYSCANCHGQEYAGMIPAYSEMVNATVAKLSVKLAAVQVSLKSAKLDPDLLAKMKEKVDGVDNDLKFIKSTHSAHNIYYVAQILAYDDEILSAAASRLNVATENTSRLPLISGAYCATLCHQKLGIESPPKIVMVKGKQLDHNLHLNQGLTCKVCHTFGIHKDVKLKQGACAPCHGDEYGQ